MTGPDTDQAPGRRTGTLRRLIACIRFDEVAVLQGAPLLGALFAMGGFTADGLLTLGLIVAGNLSLVAHVFVLNDWAGIDGDLKDTRRAGRTFLTQGATRAEVLRLALGLLALALLVLAPAGPGPVLLALGIAGLSALYSVPAIHGKGVPVFSSALHLAGGILHFLMGYAAFAPLSWQAVAIGAYFGLVFAAGHLTHEARDHDGDALAGIRTNAVAFGRRGGVVASLLLFTLAHGLLFALALGGIVPAVLAFAALLYPLQLIATLRVLRGGLDYDGLRGLQDVYRRLHAVIGLAMLATVPRWFG